MESMLARRIKIKSTLGFALKGGVMVCNLVVLWEGGFRSHANG